MSVRKTKKKKRDKETRQHFGALTKIHVHTIAIWNPSTSEVFWSCIKRLDGTFPVYGGKNPWARTKTVLLRDVPTRNKNSSSMEVEDTLTSEDSMRPFCKLRDLRRISRMLRCIPPSCQEEKSLRSKCQSCQSFFFVARFARKKKINLQTFAYTTRELKRQGHKVSTANNCGTRGGQKGCTKVPDMARETKWGRGLTSWTSAQPERPCWLLALKRTPGLVPKRVGSNRLRRGAPWDIAPQISRQRTPILVRTYVHIASQYRPLK